MQTTELPKIELHEKSGILASFLIDLPGKPYFLGRDTNCDFVVNHEQISRKHLIIRKDWNGMITIEDYGSANGVRVNGKAIKGPIEVFSSDEVQIGHIRLTLTNPDELCKKPLDDTVEETKTLVLQRNQIVLIYLAGLLIVVASLLLFFAI